ncbi:MAG: aldo/keto reductase, partial [Thermotogota bacterium]|nr:aldo/keto reductase [Thermotogota bacterium]
MKYRKVKKIEEKLSTLGYGCWGISGPSFWDGTTDDDSIKTIRKAVGEGINFFDVAPVYGFGHAEEVLGKAIKGMRNDIFIATKCGLVWDQQNRISNCLKPESIRREIEASLRRLQTDRVDLYQLHWPDPRVDIEETMDAVNELKKAGMIRYIGLSNFSLSLAERAMKVSDIASMQGLYNMLERNPKSYHNIPLEYAVEKEVLPFVKENGMAFLPYSPLFQGLLTGTFDLERENFS